MNHSIRRLFVCVALAAGVFSSLVPGSRMMAADPETPAAGAADQDASAAPAASDVQESTSVEPYTGAAIYLDEKTPPPPATIAARENATDKYPDGKLRWERQIARLSDNRYVADGYYREYHPNGQKFIEGTYSNGRQDGVWTYWYENGTKNRQVTYENGKPSGAWESYRADGTLEAKRSFKNGKREGEWTFYDETGQQPLRVESYKNGKADGEWKMWFPSGKLNRQMTFKNGQRDGPALELREDGSKVTEGSYVDGQLDGTVTTWSTDGRKTVLKYEKGRLMSQDTGPAG
jgi:antitoxin component YwqK of YwqJK toxin-antitoxin module